jgi:hypothetical protein
MLQALPNDMIIVIIEFLCDDAIIILYKIGFKEIMHQYGLVSVLPVKLISFKQSHSYNN